MPRKGRKNMPQYIAVESFVANVNGIDKTFAANRSRVYEDDPILDQTPEDWWVLLEDHQDDAA